MTLCVTQAQSEARNPGHAARMCISEAHLCFLSTKFIFMALIYLIYFILL